MSIKLILSCEHASAIIPVEYRALFADKKTLLASHQGVDIGAAYLLKQFTEYFEVPYIIGKYSRLLVELNRTPNHPSFFSEITKPLAKPEKEQIRLKYYNPYVNQLTEMIKTVIASGNSALHLSVHSFTPVLNGIVRTADVAILYDPSRRREQALATILCQEIKKRGWLSRRNYPYRGTANGLTTYFRHVFSPSQYLGIELEVNQQLLRNSKREKIGGMLVNVLAEQIDSKGFVKAKL